jgi:hypothetical protein
MSSRTLNATGLGSKSFENDRTVTLAPRAELGFDCPAHHHFSIAFSTEATLPGSWECPTCWAPAVRSDGVQAPILPPKPIRTHWDMLRERRSVVELQELLAERVALLRAGVIGPGVHTRNPPSKRRAA